MTDYRLVAVGTDGSASATRAVERAARVAVDAGATLLIVCAFERVTGTGDTRASADPGGPGGAPYAVLGTTPAQIVLRDAEGVARAAGAGKVETAAVEGDATGTLCDEVERRGADVVVVGSKGLAGFAGRLLGSVPAEVSRRAGTDVLIVRTT